MILADQASLFSDYFQNRAPLEETLSGEGFTWNAQCRKLASNGAYQHESYPDAALDAG
jgi:hypothetical protein